MTSKTGESQSDHVVSRREALLLSLTSAAGYVLMSVGPVKIAPRDAGVNPASQWLLKSEDV